MKGVGDGLVLSEEEWTTSRKNVRRTDDPQNTANLKSSFT